MAHWGPVQHVQFGFSVRRGVKEHRRVPRVALHEGRQGLIELQLDLFDFKWDHAAGAAHLQGQVRLQVY